MNPIEMKITNEALLEYGLPQPATQGGAGYELKAATLAPIVVEPGTSDSVPTGLAVSIGNDRMAGYIYPLEALAIEFEITLQNGVSVIHSDQQDELIITLRNNGREPYRVNPGDPIALLVFAPVIHPMLAVVSEFSTGPRPQTPEVDVYGEARLTGVGLSPQPGTQDRLPVSPAELIGSDRPAEDAVEDPSGKHSDDALYRLKTPLTGAETILEDREDKYDDED